MFPLPQQFYTHRIYSMRIKSNFRHNLFFMNWQKLWNTFLWQRILVISCWGAQLAWTLGRNGLYGSAKFWGIRHVIGMTKSKDNWHVLSFLPRIQVHPKNMENRGIVLVLNDFAEHNCARFWSFTFWNRALRTRIEAERSIDSGCCLKNFVHL